jgi:hypothetical protein
MFFKIKGIPPGFIESLSKAHDPVLGIPAYSED